MPSIEMCRGRWRSGLSLATGLLCASWPGLIAQVRAANAVLPDEAVVVPVSEACCTIIDSGKLTGVPAFGGKMLGAPVPDPPGNDAWQAGSGSPGGGDTPVQRPEGGSRRILWRQIQ